jgi:hypothetical protein
MNIAVRKPLLSRFVRAHERIAAASEDAAYSLKKKPEAGRQ